MQAGRQGQSAWRVAKGNRLLNKQQGASSEGNSQGAYPFFVSCCAHSQDGAGRHHGFPSAFRTLKGKKLRIITGGEELQRHSCGNDNSAA